jgi:hypothetical protein
MGLPGVRAARRADVEHGHVGQRAPLPALRAPDRRARLRRLHALLVPGDGVTDRRAIAVALVAIAVGWALLTLLVRWVILL